MDELTLTSPVFADGGEIPVKYTSDGDNINPPLVIGGVSEDAVSLVLLVDDPDAATDPDGPGKIFDHWVVYNIDPSTRTIEEDSVPKGALVGLNSLGQAKYIGPAPPNGSHRYRFQLFELSDRINSLALSSSKDEVIQTMVNLTLRKTILIGTYKRRHS